MQGVVHLLLKLNLRKYRNLNAHAKSSCMQKKLGIGEKARSFIWMQKLHFKAVDNELNSILKDFFFFFISIIQDMQILGFGLSPESFEVLL